MATEGCQEPNARLLRLPLTERQSAFCEEYARDLNGGRAYAEVYSPDRRLSSNVCSERARRLLRTPHILRRIADIRQEPQEAWLSRATVAPPPSAIRDLASEEQTQSIEELERLALVAFDENKSDFVRLAALRCLSAGLIALARAQSNSASSPAIRISIHVEHRPSGEDGFAASTERFLAMFPSADRAPRNGQHVPAHASSKEPETNATP
ncbi:terminase small subunit [Hyphomicrobium sp. NDB2Meth4]|uniref:terminase small subunit n=1 Tax=Hyphomicrobium sp. NDB2Meth4 TaxID=1892846 RepID=UPI0009FAFC2A|nr:terminase small subunit [Hyphomicrobium sp. NDB2Meth4]